MEKGYILWIALCKRKWNLSEECHTKVCCNQNSVTTLSLSRFCATFFYLFMPIVKVGEHDITLIFPLQLTQKLCSWRHFSIQCYKRFENKYCCSKFKSIKIWKQPLQAVLPSNQSKLKEQDGNIKSSVSVLHFYPGLLLGWHWLDPHSGWRFGPRVEGVKGCS